MKLSTSLVAVKKITSAATRSSFADDKLEQAAQIILEAEGVINPIVLRRTSLDSYEVVDGDFEYYAAARAREIDPRKGEMIGAFIIEDENEEVIKEQVKLLRKQKPAVSDQENSGINGSEAHLINIESQLTNLGSRITNLESRFENRVSELKVEHRRELQNMEDRLKALESRMPKPIKPLEALNNLRLSELISKLGRAGINSKIIEKIVSERDKDGNFKSCGEVVNRVNGLGDKTMIKIIDLFSEDVS
jgi:ParB family chromosome partitioning protein